MGDEKGGIVQREGMCSCEPLYVTLISHLVLFAKIGKELIKAEFPVCIRLIGLRVTKLIDLKANDAKGIKRVQPFSCVHDSCIY